MSYFDVAIMAKDTHLRERIAACAAREGITTPHPTQWADDHQWQIAAQPGWEEAWASARAGNRENPGLDNAVISDGMILAAVQAILNKA